MASRIVFPIMLALALVLPTLPAQTANVAEQYLFAAANNERAAQGIAPLQSDFSLIAAAHRHAEQMAAHQTISHRFPGEPELSQRAAAAGAHFSRIAENVAEAPSPLVLHDAWMHSPGHRENLLDAHVNVVGIAVIQRRGQLYAVQDFATLTPTLTFTAQEATVATLLEQSGLTLLPQTADARATCTGAHPTSQPAYVLRYTTDDLATLPSRLRPRLATQQFGQAAVGACNDPASAPFASYRLAILLYP